MTVSRRVRFEILRRDGHACKYCGAQAPDVALTVDHVIPVALGGSDDPTNLVTACQPCNAGKASTAPDQALVAEVDATALLFGKAIERVGELRKADRLIMAEIRDAFDATWVGWTWEFNGDKREIPRQDDWPASVERFVAAGLSKDDLLYYLGVAMRSSAAVGNTWKYFCGCCWREISNRQEMARRLIEDGVI
jgi:hypothetical protein